ncbi:hypothetical protein FGO68_gene11479 [Halteria grandinella]|uniref:Uncharacterized protein n=1 Tax=Halteria grandinella TaxID=5974 RepID=A0A8J8P520_HALGN|nr:hypothetical protein FGO68_gene11479 [Halteria grandinella]
MQTPAQNRLRLFNEFLVTMYLIPLILLTDQIDDNTVKMQSSWVLIGIYTISITINVSIFIATTMKNVSRKTKIGHYMIKLFNTKRIQKEDMLYKEVEEVSRKKQLHYNEQKTNKENNSSPARARKNMKVKEKRSQAQQIPSKNQPSELKSHSEPQQKASKHNQKVLQFDKTKIKGKLTSMKLIQDYESEKLNGGSNELNEKEEQKQIQASEQLKTPIQNQNYKNIIHKEIKVVQFQIQASQPAQHGDTTSLNISESQITEQDAQPVYKIPTAEEMLQKRKREYREAYDAYHFKHNYF